MYTVFITLACASLLLWSPVIGAPRSRRVVGGEQLALGEWPWLVSLNYKQHHIYLVLQGLRHLCGGTLIHPLWILTAAHCVHYASGSPDLGNPDSWTAVLGEYNRRLDEEMEQRIGIEAIFVNPNYTLIPKLSGDIALLKLRRPAEITPTVGIIPLDHDRPIPTATRCKAAGWGQHTADDPGQPQYGNGTIMPHVIDVKSVSFEMCNNAYGELWPLIDEKVLCFNSRHRKDTCKGDSGGPLVCLNEFGEPVLTAIVSVGMGCALEHYPGIYTRVGYFKQWIEDTVHNN